MIPPPHDESAGQVLIEADPDTTYTLEVVAELGGVSTQTVLHYREQGLLQPATAVQASESRYGLETLHKLRRIEHLRSSYEMNLAGIKAMLQLMEEVEHLQASLRARR